MTYNTIIVQLDMDTAVTPRLTFAMDLARRFEANLIGFAAAEPHALVPGGEGGMVVAEVMRQQIEDIQERLKALKEEFLGVAGDGERVSWRDELGNPTELLAVHARAADLIVTGAPSAEAAGDGRRTVEPGALILSAGRPVLFAAESLALLRAHKVLVAWKDTREARRAVADAMPFLKGAREVIVTTIAEGEQKAARESAADVVRFLMRHGVKASSDVLDVGGANREEAIAEIAREQGADLVVAGGYGHSRLREWIFGGMTRSLISDGSLNRLFSN
ncbi:universal stress protein [Chelativorans xinjiangense]|uniref:universal stress protein n=1 Tax=Chelativorans xinjiangense TaxID=2681485 RepID=UPI00135B55CD|nr:universal stress protein [Chelativorans xinjiangense]